MKPVVMKRRANNPDGVPPARFLWGKRNAFSLIELMAATAILIIILAIIFSITQQISQAWKNSTAKIEAFQGTRAAFDAMSRQISQATLNTYYDYYNAAGERRTTANASVFIPAKYGRYSDLHFISGKALITGQIGHALFFQAPVGYTDDTTNYGSMETLLNACGYFVMYDKDNSRPLFLDDNSVPNKPADRYRFRLMQFLQPGQKLAVYDPAAASDKAWFESPLSSASPPARILAENVVALVVLPKLSKAEDSDGNELTTNFEYNTRPASMSAIQALTDHQLPPVVEIILVAIDEPSAQRVCIDSTMPEFGVNGGLGSLFQTVGQLEADLQKLTSAFQSQRIAYRVFRTQIALRSAKWSS